MRLFARLLSRLRDWLLRRPRRSCDDAVDSFSRVVGSGWGTSDVGESWSWDSCADHEGLE